MKQKQALLDALHKAGAVPSRSAKRADALAMTAELNQSVHRFLADTNSALLGLQPEDWLGMTTPVNVPGTVDQYPNWRRKLAQPLERIFADDNVNKLLETVTKRRKAG
ncbi:4-alpha-glucanotransferase [Pantoea ananatis]